MVASKNFARGYACVFKEEAKCTHGDDEGYMFGLPFFVEDPGEDECRNDVIGGQPNKGRVEGGYDESCNAYTIDDGDEGDETIFYVIHGIGYCKGIPAQQQKWPNLPTHTREYGRFWTRFLT